MKTILAELAPATKAAFVEALMVAKSLVLKSPPSVLVSAVNVVLSKTILSVLITKSVIVSTPTLLLVKVEPVS